MLSSEVIKSFTFSRNIAHFLVLTSFSQVLIAACTTTIYVPILQWITNIALVSLGLSWEVWKYSTGSYMLFTWGSEDLTLLSCTASRTGLRRRHKSCDCTNRRPSWWWRRRIVDTTSHLRLKTQNNTSTCCEMLPSTTTTHQQVIKSSAVDWNNVMGRQQQPLLRRCWSANKQRQIDCLGGKCQVSVRSINTATLDGEVIVERFLQSVNALPVLTELWLLVFLFTQTSVASRHRDRNLIRRQKNKTKRNTT